MSPFFSPLPHISLLPSHFFSLSFTSSVFDLALKNSDYSLVSLYSPYLAFFFFFFFSLYDFNDEFCSYLHFALQSQRIALNFC